MEHFVDNQHEALEMIAAYLERLGVEGLRQLYMPAQINRSAVIRYLINEKLQEALANPVAATGEKHRLGQGTSKKQKPATPSSTSTKKRQ